ncbi:CPBP family intramembrane metalloprotease [Asanoa sp. WMMD1127]|uniref:CPBP family intramembrane glutamic endopeptidase n=1 Tax=Asanoa sp. WMMD1127 TaxID=3016107 RepID=UPI002416CABB|nr:CPBP family intramembrane glutamic endopeptidase [Asanoa sp. WMMD1127]MDG4826549.1 CPBP family intramembrane metalloprotease [Asanoa sp. WMMD1127]
MRVRWLVAVVAVLGVANYLNNVALAWAYPWISVVEVLVLLGLARAAGLSLADLGLARASWRRGARWALVAAVLVLVVYLLALAVPAGRDAFLDQRARLGVGGALFAALVGVPVGTVLLEEVAFRGVVWGMVARLRGPWWACWVSSVLFGLWHVLPSLGLGGNNRVVGEVYGSAAFAVTVSAVVVTVLAGLVLAVLRWRSGSLLAPIGLHWATNGLAYVLGAVLWTISG